MAEIVITGANGFIGSHIVAEFTRHGIRPTCLVREGADTSALEGLDIEVVRGDVRNIDSLMSAFTGCDCIIHNAALVRDWGDYSAFYQTNVIGTENVFNAAKACGIRRVIMTGTVSVYGEEDYPGVKDESHPFAPHYHYFLDGIFPSGMNHYRDTKTLAVQKAMEIAETYGINLTILEPVWVFGEREFHAGFYEYLCSAKDLPVMPGSRKNRFHVVYAGDLACAYYLAYRKNLPGVNRFIIGNRVAPLQDELYALFCKAAGIRKPALFPKWMVYPIGFVLELFFTILRTKNPPVLTRARVNMLYDNIVYGTDKARDELGFEATTPLTEAVERTVQWYKDKGLL